MPEESALIGGEMKRRIDQFDWASSPLGPRESWSPALLASVDIALASRFPMILWWGPELVVLYNDAYIPIFAGKHPGALGARGLSTAAWGEPEVRAVIAPMLQGVLERGESTWSENQLLILERRGFSEESYFTWSYSPVRDGDQIVGVFTAVTETTDSVVQARRLRLLSELTAATAEAPSVSVVCQRAADVLRDHAPDVPFHWTFLYGADAAPSACSWSGTPHPEGADTVDRLSQLAQQGGGALDIGSLGLTVPSGVWPEAVRDAYVLPLAGSGEQRTTGFMVVGLSPRLPADEAYRSFLELLASRVSSAIGDTRALEEERRRAESLAELDRSKSAFFSNVSHEFRTPLTLMLGPLEDALRDGPDAAWDAQRERLETARGNGLRMLKLVNTLLDFSRLEAGRAQTSYTPTDLGALTADLISVFRSAYDAAGLEFTVDVDVESELVEIDVEMWETIVFNLLSNALKYTEAGAVSVALRRDGDRFEFAVRDTGVGIAPEDVERVFERFFRSTQRVGRSLEGTGIGLSLVRELVRLHGGDIGVESELGVGSCFTVWLPRRPSAGDADPSARAGGAGVRAESFLEEARRWLAPVDGNPTSPDSDLDRDDDATVEDSGRPRILVVDDNADMRRYLGGLLAVDNDVAVAENGQVALEVAATFRPDVIVSDIMMPVLDGLDMLKQLRDDDALCNTPVMLVSARAGAEATLDGLERGADDYLVKPFSARELIARVRTLREASKRRDRDDEAQRRRHRFRAALAAAASELNRADNLDEVATAVRDALADIDTAFAATVSVRAADGEHLEQFFSDGQIPVDMAARYRRIPLAFDTPATRAVTEASPLFFDDTAQYGASFPDTAAEHERLGARASAVLPLTAPDGDVFGCLSIAWSTPRVHDGERITHLLELGDVVARCVARVQLVEREREIATTLQLGLLAAETRSTAVVARTFYRSANDAMAVGGDWYDIVDLPDGRIGVAVGDVVGRGLPAATTMGQLRAALATAIIHDPDPMCALTMLDRFAAHVPGARCATAVVAVIDPERQELTFATAGHPPAIVASPSGEIRLLEGGRSWPLRVDPERPRTAAVTASFPPGSLLLFYTDGLVERRGESLTTGIDRLAGAVSAAARQPLRQLEDVIVGQATATGAGADDIAFVAVRSVVQSPAMLVEAFPASTTELRAQRNRFRDWLAGLGVPDNDLNDFVLAVSEGCANAIEHGSGSDESNVVSVEACADDDGITVAISDAGSWQAGIEGFLTGRGRGHTLMDAFADSVDVRTDHQGSTVILRLAIRNPTEERMQ